jgi:membrane protease YdiL (CAAX protease family)
LQQLAEERASDRPLWRRVVDFPLVAMMIATALFIAADAGAAQLTRLLPLLPPDAAAALKAAIMIAVVLAVYKLVIARLGERPRDDLPMRAAPRGLAIGILVGFLLFCALVGIAALFDVYNIVGAGDTRELVKDLAGMTLTAAFLEELLFRGILFRWIEAFGGSWAALVLTSALFGLAHIFNANATWVSSLAITVEAGVMLGGAYMLARNLWVPIGLHAAWNFTQGFIFDVPVSGNDMHGLVQAKLSGPVLLSGGSFGLEASMIGVVLSIPLGACMIYLAARNGRIVQPMWVRRSLSSSPVPQDAA